MYNDFHDGQRTAPQAEALWRNGGPKPRQGGLVLVLRDGRKSIAPTGTGDLRRGMLLRILRDLELRLEDLR